MTDITLSAGGPVILKLASDRQFRGLRIPGASLLRSDTAQAEISLHVYEQPLFTLQLLQVNCAVDEVVSIHFQGQRRRLEYALTGEWAFADASSPDPFLAGHCRVTSEQALRFKFRAGEGGHIFFCLFSQELVSQTPIADEIKLVPLMPATLKVRDIVDKILHNPFDKQYRDGFYDYKVRKLLFYQAASPPYTPPGMLTPGELAAVNSADAIICADLDRHYSIEELARLTGTNTQVIKRGFKQVFGMGTFRRRQVKKMERAIFLLESTDMQVQEVAVDAGYATVTGFINEFRKQFGVSPADWRRRNKK